MRLLKKPLFLLILIVISCATKKEIVEIIITTTTELTTTTTTSTTTTTTVRTGFRYDVPEDMRESPNEARRLKYDNLLVEKGCNVFESPMIIAIRHTDNFKDYSLKDFAVYDQNALKSQVKIRYEDNWSPPGFSEKKIEFLSYQFSYKYGDDKIFQRSVYLRENSRYYIISMSTRSNKILVTHDKNDLFWNSVRID